VGRDLHPILHPEPSQIIVSIKNDHSFFTKSARRMNAFQTILRL